MKKTPTNTTTDREREIMLFDMLARGLGGGSPSDAIEAQERRGTQEAAKSHTLPTKGGSYTGDAWPLLIQLGFVKGEPVPGDPLFTFATLPEGWKQQPTDHAMYVQIVDAKGRKRVQYFYKAAFYDRDAFLWTPECRFEFRQNFDNQDRATRWTVQTVELWDRGVVPPVMLHTVTTTQIPEDVPEEARVCVYEEDRRNAWAVENTRKRAYDALGQWLSDRGYADYKNPLAYWDEA